MTAAATKPPLLERIPCVGRTAWDPYRRTDRCGYFAEYIALPAETGACLAHAVDFRLTREITALDVERSNCADCQAVAAGVYALSPQERRRRGRLGALPKSRWCEKHRSERA